MNLLTVENASSKTIVIAYTKLLAEEWFLVYLVEIKINFLEIDGIAGAIKDYICENKYRNREFLPRNFNKAINGLTPEDLNQSDEAAVKNFNRQLYSKKHEYECQVLLEQIWSKIVFLIPDNVASFSFSLELPGRSISEIISKKEKLSIKPQDGREVAYSSGYIRELLDNMQKFYKITVAWKEKVDGRQTEKFQNYWNKEEGKLELKPCWYSKPTLEDLE